MAGRGAPRRAGPGRAEPGKRRPREPSPPPSDRPTKEAAPLAPTQQRRLRQHGEGGSGRFGPAAVVTLPGGGVGAASNCPPAARSAGPAVGDRAGFSPHTAAGGLQRLLRLPRFFSPSAASVRREKNRKGWGRERRRPGEAPQEQGEAYLSRDSPPHPPPHPEVARTLTHFLTTPGDAVNGCLKGCGEDCGCLPVIRESAKPRFWWFLRDSKLAIATILPPSPPPLHFFFQRLSGEMEVESEALG